MGLSLHQAPVAVAERVYAQQVAIGEHKAHPAGRLIPFSATERELTLVHRWNRIVELFGDHSALEEANRILTYTQTNALANRIAHTILTRHVAPDTPVVILFDIEMDLLISLLSV